MALKNTYTTIHAGRHIQEAQDALMRAGASGVQLHFDQGRVVGLWFMITIADKEVSFRLPIKWENFQNVLKKENNRKADDDDYAYRVAWACTKDWILAQMAFIESENVSLAQVFLPYAVAKDGQTLFEKVAQTDGNFLLGNGK